MDYKRIIKSRSLRLKILCLLSFVPDKLMIEFQYWLKTGRRLNLNNPKRFTEKLQWYKLYYKNSKLIQCVDKYDVREYVKLKGLENLLVYCYGVFDSVNEIRWESLPKKYVMKATLGSGSNSVIVVRDQSRVDIDGLRNIASEWLKADVHKKSGGREWPYYCGKQNRIIFEDYIEEDGDLIDYKFFCFSGKVKFFYVRSGYSENHNNAQMAFFNRELEYLPGVGMDYCAIAGTRPNLPSNIEEMISYAENLSEDFPHVRVDLYNVKSKIFFGELTFYNASGYMMFIPDKWDLIFGKHFNLIEHTWDGDI